MFRDLELKIIQIVLEAIVQDRDNFSIITSYINKKLTDLDKGNSGRWLCMTFKENFGGYSGALPAMNLLMRAGTMHFLLFHLA